MRNIIIRRIYLGRGRDSCMSRIAEVTQVAESYCQFLYYPQTGGIMDFLENGRYYNLSMKPNTIM